MAVLPAVQSHTLRWKGPPSAFLSETKKAILCYSDYTVQEWKALEGAHAVVYLVME